MPEFYDAFISYGRADSKAFATKLYERLTAQGYEVWFDQNDIPLGVDYQQEIDEGLERSHNFIFVMAPHSVNSPYCGLEIERAVLRQKRIIPVLHVDELPRQTWQSRNPGGTDAEWADYQAQKLHFGDVRNPRIHPLLGKINWVYAREKIDDFEAALSGLISIFERDKDYVRQHTVLLIQAIYWQENQRRSPYLLIGKERQIAEQWLKIRFEQEQPPCLPAELHCEYITESIKNGNNMRTQVFLAHASADTEIMKKVRRSLWLKGITVWTSSTDIQTGETFKEAIKRGIEQADNLVYLLSPDVVTSEYCQLELDYAIALNKRIIPLLVAPITLEAQPPELQKIQYIDLTDNEQEADYDLDESQLLRILQTDKLYHENHKILTTKAIKWDQQLRNPSLLLRGYNLKQAEAWLKTAKQRTTYCPTKLQTEFIEASLRQPPVDSLDVFVSYSRADSDFARKLNENLQIVGKLTWFDQESIATSSANFQQEINRGIEVSDNFVFILSPDSVNSEYCAGEVEYAAKLNKRFITVLHRPIKTADLHPKLANIQWLDFNRHNGDFGQNFNELIRALDTDREHVHNHTKWSQRALEWEQKKRTEDLLLRGNELAIAANWLEIAQAEHKQPSPTDLQQQFLASSQTAIDAEIRKEKRQKTILRSLLGVMTGVAIAAIGATVLAVGNQRKAVQGEIKSVVALSEAKLAINREFEALGLGLKAAHLIDVSPNVPQRDQLKASVTNILRQSLYTITEQNRIVHEGYVYEVDFSSDGTMLATADSESIKIWQLDGKLLAKLDDEDYQENHTNFFFSLDDRTIITANPFDVALVKFWDLSGELLFELADGKEFESVTLSPAHQEHRTIKTFDGEKTQLWDTDGKLITTLKDVPERRFGLRFSQDGEIFVSIISDGTEAQQIRVWQRDGSILSEFTETDGRFKAVGTAAERLLFWSEEEGLATIKNRQGETIEQFEATRGTTLNATHILQDSLFNPQQDLIALIYRPQSSATNAASVVQFWRANGELVTTFEPYADTVNIAKFSHDGQFFVTTNGSEKVITLWDLQGQKSLSLGGHGDWIIDTEFSPDMQRLASISYDGQLKLWANNLLINTIDSQQMFVTEMGDRLLTHSDSDELKLHPMDIATVETASQTLIENIEGDVNIQTSANDSIILASESDSSGSNRWYGPVQIWTETGDEPRTLIKRTENSPDEITFIDAAISPDNQTVSTVMHGYGAESTFYGPVQLWNRDGSLRTTLVERQLDEFTTHAFDWIAAGARLLTGDTIWSEKSKANVFIGSVFLWDNQGNLVKEITNTHRESTKDGAYIQAHYAAGTGDRLWLAHFSAKKFGPIEIWDTDGNLVNTLNDTIDISSTSTFLQPKIKSNSAGTLFLKILQEEIDDDVFRNVLQLFDQNGELIETIIDSEAFNEEVNTFFVGEKGEMLVTIVSDTASETIQVWDEQGKLRQTILDVVEGTPYQHQVLLSSDRDILAIAINRRTIRLWDLESGEVQATISFSGDLSEATFSKDSQYFAAGSFDETLQLWNRRDNSITHLNDHNSAVDDLSFSKDSDVLVSQSADRLIMYQLEGLDNWDNVIAQGCNWLANYLSSSENLEDEDAQKLCRDYLPASKSIMAASE